MKELIKEYQELDRTCEILSHKLKRASMIIEMEPRIPEKFKSPGLTAFRENYKKELSFILKDMRLRQLELSNKIDSNQFLAQLPSGVLISS